MNSDTKTIFVNVPVKGLFSFLAEPMNLPRWAVGFCRSIRREGDRWLVLTAQGEVGIRYETDPARGTIDFYISPRPGAEAAAYSRVVPNGEGSQYIFTQFQAPGMPDAVFEGQKKALGEELAVLKKQMEEGRLDHAAAEAAGRACPTR